MLRLLGLGYLTACALGHIIDVERPGPAAHYVIRASDLSATLDFLENVLSLRVLRHEENPTACPITCNGDFALPWSKTMVGTESEDKAFALEVTFNYGIDRYEPGVGLRRFEMKVGDLAKSRKAAMGFSFFNENANRLVVTGPDGYVYALEEHQQGEPKTSFAKVVVGAPDPVATAEWYRTVLGMTGASTELAFPGDSLTLVIEPADADLFKVGQWDGRNAFSLPSAKVRAVYDSLKAASPQSVVHDLQEINEETGLGVLLIAILRDPNGLELCLVSSEAFEPAIAGAADFKRPDFARRLQLAAEYAAAAAANEQKADKSDRPFVV